MPKDLRILFVDDEKTYLEVMKRELTRMGYSVVGVGDGKGALERLSQRDFDVVVLDIMLPGLNGVETLKRIKDEGYPVEVIMLTGRGTIETAVESMKMGAYDYMTKPCRLSELEMLINKAYEKKRLTRENVTLKRLVSGKVSQAVLLGKSSAIMDVFKLMDKVAGADSTVLIQGESGTGKELVARSIHAKSRRTEKPFVVVNCAALQETLLESELFGHARGAFTGAHEARMGLFEAADGGTLFLDEIGEMSSNTQSKFLRVLQSGETRRVGENRVIEVDVRVLAATNKDLRQEVKENKFREDLFYRLNTITINLSPLRERKEDIPVLVEHFINLYKEKGLGKRIDKKTMKIFTDYTWPGNVRELQNTIERMVILSDGDTIEDWTLPDYFYVTPFGGKLPEDIPLAELERRYIHHVLTEKKGNKTQAAQVLGISLKTLYNKLKEYNMSS